MGILRMQHFRRQIDPAFLQELRSWAEDEAGQLESVADHLNVLLDHEQRFLVEALAKAAERLRHLVSELPQA